MRKFTRLATVFVISGAMSLQLVTHHHVSQAEMILRDDRNVVSIASAQPSVPAKLTLISEQPITSGAVLRTYDWTSTRNNQKYTTRANVIVVDLHNPYVKLDVMTGIGGKFHSKQTVLGMARETGAVAGINGDFFHLEYHKPPFGPSIASGEWLQTPMGREGWYTFSITGDNKPIIDYYTFEGKVIAANGQSFPLAGINRPVEIINGVHSHVDRIHLYTPVWGQQERAVDHRYQAAEVLVVNDRIVDMNINNGLPMMVPEDGYILRANGAGTEFIKQNMKIGDPIFVQYDMKPLDPNNKADVKQFKMMIGGHSLMVDEGKAVPFTASPIGSAVARTGVGYSKDGRFVYLITVDRYGDSQGMTMPEFQQFMIKLGVWRGMNLDGGGSTTMVSRPLGEFDVKLTNRPQGGGQRAVVNGIGVYTSAPPGDLKGITIGGQRTLFLGEKVTFQVNAYDTYYNPMVPSMITDLQWSSKHRLGTFTGNTFTPTKTGKETIIVSSKSARAEMEVEIIGAKQLESLKINSSPIIVKNEGQTFKVPVVATTKSGIQRTLPPEVIQWEIIGFEGDIVGDTLTVRHIPDRSRSGQIVASYDGFSTVLDVAFSTSTLWADFDQRTYPITHIAYPSEVTGKAYITKGFPYYDEDNHGLFITYNFTEGNGNKASYAQFNAAEDGVLIEGEPYRISMNVLGDQSGNWLRAEVWDADGNLQRINLSTDINWHGWKTISADLTSYQLKYPIKLRRIYVASPANEGQDTRGQIGQIAIDDITFDYKSKAPVPKKNKIKLAINRPSITINGEDIPIDQPPILDQSTTLVPIRFVITAMGGEVDWDQETQKVTLTRGTDRIEMWIGHPEINVNGQTVTSPIAPKIVSDRTMIPLRVISEQLGWVVRWEDATKSITLE